MWSRKSSCQRYEQTKRLILCTLDLSSTFNRYFSLINSIVFFFSFLFLCLISCLCFYCEAFFKKTLVWKKSHTNKALLTYLCWTGSPQYISLSGKNNHHNNNRIFQCWISTMPYGETITPLNIFASRLLRYRLGSDVEMLFALCW